jgi:SAM-dependent methyltransferase
VLEVPCGAGRLSRRLAQKAAELTIVDVEPKMVARALAACAGGGARVVGEIADMRTLDLGRVFDVALIPREALQLLAPTDAARALSAIGAHLASGGLLFVDLSMFRRADRARPDPDYYDEAAADGVWLKNWTRRLADGSQLIRRSVQRHEPNAIAFRLDYRVRHANGERRRWRSRMRLFLYDRDWVERATPPGMRLEHAYGDYDKTEFSSVAPRLLALYRKSA